MEVTNEELAELKTSQERIDDAVRILEALLSADLSKKRHRVRSKMWKRMLGSINAVAKKVSTKNKAAKRATARVNRDGKKSSVALFRSQGAISDEIDSSAVVNCYICKSKFAIGKRHDYYRRMCGPCGDFNLQKRAQTADLAGKVAIVTGARVKIGFQVALKLLRANCFVIATTRFTADSIQRYSAQDDYNLWKSRLLVVRLELGNRAAIELFCAEICARFPRIDILINNAAQTIARPPEFYRDVLAAERDYYIHYAESAPQQPPPQTLLCNEVLASALITDTESDVVSLFPVDMRDPKNDNQQLDLRPANSWVQTLETAPVEELLTDLAVNCAAPYILIQRLTPAMIAEPGADLLKHSSIVNVSAVEGMFHVYNKSAQHPQSNMAKAALNMMTRTSGAAYWRRHRIAMNAVDTGLVTNEYPAGHPNCGDKTPLDEVDGAARILDPIFAPLLGAKVEYGTLLKDFAPSAW